MGIDRVVLRFDVTGMMCAACSSRLERVLAMQPGVASASVNLAAAVATVTVADGHDAGGVSRAVVEAAGGAGFGASPVRSGEDGNAAFMDRQAEARRDVAARRRRLLPEAVLTAAVMAVPMGPMLGLPLPEAVSPFRSPLAYALAQMLLVVPVMAMGRSFYLSGIPRLLRGTPNMDSLVALGTGTAFAYSLWGVAGIAWGDAATAHRAVGELYFESCAMLIAMISFGKYLEAASMTRLTESLGGLLTLSPRTALKVLGADGAVGVVEVPLRDVAVGDVLEVRPGMRVPVDGTVLSGRAAVDASMLTGESMPVSVVEGDAVVGGTLDVDGCVRIRAGKVGADTALARMARMVREAQDVKAPVARMADRVSLFFVPAVLACATLSGLAWYFLGGASLDEALRTFVAVTVVACPCSLGLATPLSVMVGTSRGAGLGVLVRNGAVLEAVGRLTTVVFDKTGTLTTGSPRVRDVVPTEGFDADGLAAVAAAMERGSAHPLARAVTGHASELGLDVPTAEDVSTVPGEGLRGRVAGSLVLVGSQAFMASNGVGTSSLDGALGALSETGRTAVLVAVDGRPAGVIGVEDELRPEAVGTVDALAAMGIRVMLLSGDAVGTAEAVGRRAHVADVRAGVGPAGKAAVVAGLRARGEVVAMVGDGINDAPAMATADVGMAMAEGIDVAVDAGDVVLAGGKAGRGLLGVVTALRLGRAVLGNVRENLAWAFGYNLVLIPIAAGALKCLGGPGMSPMLAGAAMACSSVSVVLNAMRLQRFRA